MPFKKGQSGNPQGREPGKGNYTTEAVKKILTEFVSKEMESAQDKYNAIKDPEKQLNILAKFVQYVLPKNMDLRTDIEVNKSPKRIGFK